MRRQTAFAEVESVRSRNWMKSCLAEIESVSGSKSFEFKLAELRKKNWFRSRHWHGVDHDPPRYASPKGWTQLIRGLLIPLNLRSNHVRSASSQPFQHQVSGDFQTRKMASATSVSSESRVLHARSEATCVSVGSSVGSFRRDEKPGGHNVAGVSQVGSALQLRNVQWVFSLHNANNFVVRAQKRLDSLGFSCRRERRFCRAGHHHGRGGCEFNLFRPNGRSHRRRGVEETLDGSHPYQWMIGVVRGARYGLLGVRVGEASHPGPPENFQALHPPHTSR